MNYKDLSEKSRVWIYQSKRELQRDEASQINQRAEKFLAEWAAHGSKLQAAFEIFYDRFLVLFADEAQIKASGCSIDASVHFFKSLEIDFNLELFDRLEVAFQQDGEVKSISLNEFQKLLKEGQLSENTLVFNNLVETKAAFEKQWKVPVKESWHQQLMTG